MASQQRNVDFVIEQLADAGDVSARKMFGEFAIYCRAKIVALFCDDQLFVKPTVAGRAFIGQVEEAAPYPGAKPWFLISGDRCEDGEWLSELVKITERELPAPKPKPLKTKPKTKTKPKSASSLGKAKRAAKRQVVPQAPESKAKSSKRVPTTAKPKKSRR